MNFQIFVNFHFFCDFISSIYDDYSSHFHASFYSPWHDPTEDPVATNLIYQQNVRGVKFGEYRCEKEEDLAMIAAQQYYIEYGNDLNEERLFNLIPNYIPDYCLQRDNAVDMWHQLVLQAYKKVHTNTMSVFMNFCPVLDS